jgi:hypothetical protein
LSQFSKQPSTSSYTSVRKALNKTSSKFYHTELESQLKSLLLENNVYDIKVYDDHTDFTLKPHMLISMLFNRKPNHTNKKEFNDALNSAPQYSSTYTDFEQKYDKDKKTNESIQIHLCVDDIEAEENEEKTIPETKTSSPIEPESESEPESIENKTPESIDVDTNTDSNDSGFNFD